MTQKKRIKNDKMAFLNRGITGINYGGFLVSKRMAP